MTMTTQTSEHDDDMPSEIDFSKGTRGKFFKAGARLSLPVYLDAAVQDYLTERAAARGIDVTQLVNELLKKDIELIEAAR
jgi:hypothetical protein